jgi:mRNA deadenylase 3'-5' endonuclease subunit Ccr4
MQWSLTAAPMRSAYAEDNGEPNFSNYARVKEDDPFIDTLDYIFISPEWKVESTKSIVHRNIANGPYPNALEPSDHVLISADLSM